MKELTQAIYSALAAKTSLTTLLGSATGIYPDKAPKSATLPYVVFAQQPGEPKYTFTGRAFEWVQYNIQGVTGPTEDPEAGYAIAKEIDAALTDAALTVASHTLMYGRRQAGIFYREDAADGDSYYHIGGRYKFGVDPA